MSESQGEVRRCLLGRFNFLDSGEDIAASLSLNWTELAVDYSDLVASQVGFCSRLLGLSRGFGKYKQLARIGCGPKERVILRGRFPLRAKPRHITEYRIPDFYRKYSVSS